VVQNGITSYLQGDGEWNASRADLSIISDTHIGEFTIEIPFKVTGNALLEIIIKKIESNVTLNNVYVAVNAVSMENLFSVPMLKRNSVNTRYDETNNVIISRNPEFGPAYNVTALSGFIKNGIFYYDGNVIKPAKAWSWDGGTPQQMAVYNHLQLLCYHSKPNNLITGDIVNADVIKTAAIYVWGGKEHLLISGTYNYLNGRIEGAVLREFVRYDDMWGDVTGSSLPDVETGSATSAEEGGSSSSGVTNENTTNVVIGGEGGGSVTIDPFLSDTSTNAVQNKAIKAYVDAADKALSDRITEIEENGAGGGGQVDTAMSATSENAVQNKVIKTYVDNESRKAYDNAYNDAVAASTAYTNSAKQQLIASKAGAFYVEPSTDLFIVFTTEEKKAAYISSGDESGVLGKFALGGGGGASETLYDMQVINLQPSFSFTTSSEKMMISAGFRSRVKYAGDTDYQTFSESAIFSVEVYKQGSASASVVSAGNVVANGGTFSIDMKPYVGNGSNTVIIRAVGLISSKEGVASTTVAVTTMSLSAFGFDWAKAWVQGQDYRINLRVQGSLAKKLYVQINGKTITESVGTWNSADVAYGFDLKASNHPASSGVYQLKMWLKADASGVTSETLTYNIMCVRSTEVSTAKLVCINEVATEVDNYSESKIFAYAAYNGGGSSATPTLSIQKGSTTIASSSVSVNTGVQHDYTYAFALAMTETSAAITAKAVFGNTQTASITLKNETSFAPVSGYNFYMNAATRSNGDTYKTYLVNEANGERIYASWQDMAWVDGMDGWTTDEDGNKCLLIPALSKAYVNYAPMQNASVLTLEMQYKVKNVSDFSEDIITIASGAASSWMGVKVKPTNITLHSQSLFTDDLKQGYNLQDEKMVHLVVAIIQNYQSTGNIAVIYVNGVKKCSFEWSRGDTFSHGGELVLGSDTADLYLYMMRVYATQFDWPQVMQNYISSIHSAATKAQTKRREDSVLADNDTFDYDKIYGKYNTFVVELPRGAALPDILHPAEVENTNLYINIVQDKTCSIQGEFLNVPLEGQGTTAMTYYRWNLRSKTDTIRITAKKNVASSMHSHKMGATRLFNDLNRAIVGANEANGRVSVYQYPAYGLRKVENEDAVGTYYYESMGLYTIGPDKGDKPTFGYDNSAYKSTLIHMEGTDHSPRGVGMDYPWEQMTVGENVDGDMFIGPKNSLGQLGDEAWEIGACGDKKTASDMKAYLDVEFAPAYRIDYECTPLIAALPSGETIASVNADVAAFRAREAWNGFAYGDCIIFDADYNTYYFNEVSQSYVADGRKAHDGLTTSYGFSTSALASASDKAAYIRQCRRLRYRAEMEQYWHRDDSLFHACFLDLIGATDNEKKNSYPYKFGTLASGSRWRWRQDDLDTIFDINNQGSADKSYSIMNTDKQGGTMIFKGNTSYHWRCIREYYKDEMKTMMQTIFTKMISLSPYGSSDIQKLVGCIRHYFWDYAQEYFTGGAYNLDAKWTYEDAWRIYKSNSNVNAVHPLQQSLGSHYEAEVAWVTLRMLFLASMNEYGAFVTYNDISEGQIAFRQGGDFTFNLTPAIDMRPSVIQGQSKTGAKFASGRVKAGNAVAITTTADSSADTMVYVQGADWLSDAGDFSKVRLGSTSRTFAITSKRLQKIKVGDATASKVTTNIEGLDIGACPSVEEIDARNITALHGEVDLTKCPRLRRAYFGGTSATSILLPDGSKIQKYGLPSTIQSLELRKLPLLTTSGLTYGDLNALTYLWVEDNAYLDGYDMLKAALEDGSPLNNIRVIGFNKTASADDTDFLLELAEGDYHGITSTGAADNTIPPVLVGTVNYDTIDGDVYDALKAAYGNNLTINYNKLIAFIKFVDDEVKRVLIANGVDTNNDGGIEVEEAEAVTDIGNWFANNNTITSFDELQYFIGIKAIGGNYSDWTYGFKRCTNLKSVILPASVTSLKHGSFEGCTSLKSVGDMSHITTFLSRVFYGCSALSIDVNLPNLNSLGGASFYGSGIKKVLSLGNITALPSDYERGCFRGCTALTFVELSDKMTSIAAYSFYGCTALETFICRATTPPSLANANALTNTNNCPIYVPDASVDAYKSASNWSTFASRIKPLSYIED
jgi:hypothetical protein